jgi:hypothetical protein
MPLPFIPIAIGAGILALGGIGKGIRAIFRYNEAKDTNNRAKTIYDEALESLDRARLRSKNSLQNLGELKLKVLDDSVMRFISILDKIHGIEMDDPLDFDELSRLRLNEHDVKELKKASNLATSVLGSIATGSIAGGLAGGAIAFGAYGAVATFGTASTGTAIATLTGAAAKSATLAWLGGGPLVAGGFGVAGGTMLLGGIVAGPALLVLGIFMDAKAGKNKEEAYSRLAEARKYKEEYGFATSLCDNIKKRSDMYIELVASTDEYGRKSIDDMERVVEAYGYDHKRYNKDSKVTIRRSMEFAGAIKRIIDTPILTEDGKLTTESEQASTQIKQFLGALS